jgi:hypothetical protein
VTLATAARFVSDAADEERGHVRLLPHREVVAENDGDLRVELHAVTLPAGYLVIGSSL